MTTDALAGFLRSRPRRRVAGVCFVWLVVAFLTPVKSLLKLPALPFLWVANLVYDLKTRIASKVGEVQAEEAERELKNELEDDDGL